ncbi:hypothetical protein [Lysinibacillus sp. NPDC056185]|uniref:hypothetical protein n=1 Tax=Lysinibacillus sp. NPDC056185 TaxID=3345739 RepID=UPI0039F06D45
MFGTCAQLLNILKNNSYNIHINICKDGETMEQMIKEMMSPSNQYKVQIIKKRDRLYTTEVYMWQEDCGYEFWSPIKIGLSLIETEEGAVILAIEHLREYSDEIIIL